MIGNGYWSTGITVTWQYSGSGDYGWAASLEYLDDGFCNDDADVGRVSTEGTLHTRYAVRQGETADALTVVIDTIKADAERLGIRWGAVTPGATVYYKGDGEDEDFPPPDGWREMVNAQAERLGWQSGYRMDAMVYVASEDGTGDDA